MRIPSIQPTMFRPVAPIQPLRQNPQRPDSGPGDDPLTIPSDPTGQPGRRTLTMDLAQHLAGDMRPRDADKVRSAMKRLGQSQTGRYLLERLHEDRVPVRVVPDAALQTDRGRAGGMYNSASRTIALSNSVASNTDKAALVLAHEAQHHVDVAGTGATASLWDEARAFHAQARVAQELGVADPGYGTGRDGKIRSLQTTFDALTRSQFYGHLPYASSFNETMGTATAVAAAPSRLGAAGSHGGPWTPGGQGFGSSPASRTPTTFG
jgi:hypothetical protein